MTITLSDDARRRMALFEDATGATAVDCVEQEFDEERRIVYVVATGEMGQAIGPGGSNVERLEERLGCDVELVEDADTPANFVANALAPAAVYNVTMSENDDLVAYAEVDSEDRGIAIGAGGRNIELARRLARRHFDVDDVQLA
ncbi:MAG: NusA-like transcription termination signal-binding factor [Halobacteriaceae archaeon]